MAEHEQLESRETEQHEPGSDADRSPANSPTTEENGKPTKTHYTTQFWPAFGGLCFTGLVSAMDGSIVSTALPSIVADLAGAENYVWVVNVYFLTRPLGSSICNDRRYGHIYLRKRTLRWGELDEHAHLGTRGTRGNGTNQASVMHRLKRIDLVGNVLIAWSTFAILWALTYGGTKYLWSQAEVVAPLVVGFVGLAAFLAWENSRWCAYPVMQVHHFNSRTASAAFFISFVVMILSFWTVYFYPVYFQAMTGESPTMSGLSGGMIVTKTGRYKPVHLAAAANLTLSLRLNSILTSQSSKALWAVFQILAGMGLGSLISTTLQAVQAGLPESEVASTTATWSYIRNRFDQLSSRFDPSIGDLFVRGQAYEHATAQFVQSFDPATRVVIMDAYRRRFTARFACQYCLWTRNGVGSAVREGAHFTYRLDSEFGLAEKEKEDCEKNHGKEIGSVNPAQ
ncbi:hypothetical protein V1505DRAFT_388584 [Lipomyces doorenjongii]